MKRNTKCFYQENLNNDKGIKWRQLLKYALERADTIELKCSDTYERSLYEAYQNALSYINYSGLKSNFNGLYHTKKMWQRSYDYSFIIGKFNLDEKLKAKFLKYKSFLSFSINKVSYFDPAFYVGNIPILWTVSSNILANILLTESERKIWVKNGFLLDVNNGVESLTEPL